MKSTDNNMDENQEPVSKGEIIIYKAPDGHAELDVRLEEESVWLTQKQIADLFGIQRPAITKHSKNIFDSSELNKNSVSSILEHTAPDGKTYKTKFYNLFAKFRIGLAKHYSSKKYAFLWGEHSDQASTWKSSDWDKKATTPLLALSIMLDRVH